jgi:hydrogenase-1 operon protein HyaF
MSPADFTKDSNLLQFAAANKNRDSTIDDLLREIKSALTHLLDTGEETIIDLNDFPCVCGKECELTLKGILGTGAATASLNIFGCDSIHETGVHGVWWVHHLDDNGAILTKALYISYVPSILPAQREDIEYGVTVLNKHLTNSANKNS